MESERAKFRPGESPGRSWGGNVINEPFAQALYKTAKNYGYESQLSLSRALGKKTNSTVSSWYHEGRTPTPDEFGAVIRLLKPNGEELEKLVVPYCQLLLEDEVKRETTYKAAYRASINKAKPSATPIGRWIDEFCRQRIISQRKFFASLGFQAPKIKYFGLSVLSQILEEVPQMYNLPQDETERLSEAVAQTIEQKVAEGKKLVAYSYSRTQLSRMQKDSCQELLTGKQAGDEIGVSREAIRLRREKHNWPALLTREQVEILRGEIKKPR